MMKHKYPKKPTREQKKRIAAIGLDWREYLIVSEDKLSMVLTHKPTGERKDVLC